MRLSRREWMRVAGSGLLIPAAAREAEAQRRLRFVAATGGGGGGQTILQQSDFTYLGSFLPPQTAGGNNTDFGPGLAHRYVGGNLRFFSTITPPPAASDVYEFNYPGEALFPAAQPTASVVNYWGNIFSGKLIASTSPPGSVVVGGLKWDETDQRLYAAFGDTYSTSGLSEPALTYATLGTFPTSASFGPWKIPNAIGYKRCKTGLLDIPSPYRAGFGGKRFGIGFGGYESAITANGVSLGPSLCVLDPITSEAANSVLSPTIVCGYPYTFAYTDDRCHHDGAHNSPYEYADGWEHQGSTYYWSWGDQGMGGEWIHGTNKTGVVYLSAISVGRVYYELSTVKAAGHIHGLFVYDPADLLDVYTGTKQQWQIQPTNTWYPQFTETEMGTYPFAAWQDYPPRSIEGITWVPEIGKLFVKVLFCGIHVFSVAT